MVIQNCRENADPGICIRGPHLRAPKNEAPGRIRIHGPGGTLDKFARATGVDLRKPSESTRELRVHLLVDAVRVGLNRARERSYEYEVVIDRPPWTLYLTAKPPLRGRPRPVPALAIAIADLVDCVGATPAALALLSTNYSDSPHFPGDFERCLGLSDGIPPDGRMLVRRVAQRLSSIRRFQRGPHGYPTSAS